MKTVDTCWFLSVFKMAARRVVRCFVVVICSRKMLVFANVEGENWMETVSGCVFINKQVLVVGLSFIFVCFR